MILWEATAGPSSNVTVLCIALYSTSLHIATFSVAPATDPSTPPPNKENPTSKREPLQNIPACSGAALVSSK